MKIFTKEVAFELSFEASSQGGGREGKEVIHCRERGQHAPSPGGLKVSLRTGRLVWPG